ncbi:M60 family metallopeptidase [Mucilaginibacter lacusdianchii]|uniref:M60 family metallopeptidase n=1 Tax=Mucilaginibacter lacusdianchii TaxID=2684211 RepID=UPI00131DC632|nr:M60 family metallopeptidase [Mucilaginibacter sp. JXJ CY 39]
MITNQPGVKWLSLCTKITNLLFFGLLLLSSRVLAQYPDSTVLLKNINQIPFPDTPHRVCATLPLDERSQTIAAGTIREYNQQLSVILTSRLDKGKIMIIGSNQYLQKPLLNNQNVQKLLQNTLIWAHHASKKQVQLVSNNPDLVMFLKQARVKTILDSANISSDADVIILTQDVMDSVKRNSLEAFIRKGGTLIFGSPVADQMQQYKLDYYDANLNQLFMKAGLYHLSMFVTPDGSNNDLNMHHLPPYLHIVPTLAQVKKPGFVLDGIYASTIANYLNNNSDTTTLSRSIADWFSPPRQPLIVPSLAHPVSQSDTKTYFTYKTQKFLAAQQQTRHPLANYVDPDSKEFPGQVDASAARVNEQITIPVKVGTQGLLEPHPVYYRWHSTGLYVPAGEKVTVTIPVAYLPQHLKAQIGVHDDALQHMPYFTRSAVALTKTFELDKVTTEIYSPFGGLLLINIPDTSTLKAINLQVNSAVKSPFFKLGQTTLANWNQTIRNYPAPWAELATDKIILTVPSYRIRNLDDPEKLMKFWDEVMDADARLAQISPTRKHPERIIIDRQVAYGYMFTVDNRIVAPDDESCELMLNESLLRSKGSWGHFHELGHRHQFWGIDYKELSEVTVNLYTMYVYDQVLHKGIYNHENISSKQAVTDSIKKYMAGKPSFEKFGQDPFLALKMYIQVIQDFGWQLIEQVFKTFRALPEQQYPATLEARRDYWFTCMCHLSKKDLSSFFDKWQVPISTTAKQAVRQYPTWLPAELR